MTDTFQWERCTAAGGSGCVDIGGATGNQYTSSGDIGDYVRARGYRNGILVGESNPIGPITVAPPPPPPGTFGAALAAWIADAAASNFGGPWTGEGHLPDSAGPIVPVSTSAGLNAALAAAVDGDIIELASGAYNNITITGKIHAPASPVTVRPAAGAAITIGTNAPNHAWFMTNSTGFKLDRLPFSHAYGCCVKLDTHVKDIEFNGCAFTQYGQNITGHGILTEYECERVAVWDCKTYGGGDHGLYLGSHGSPAGAAFGLKGLLVANHLSYDNFKGPGSASGESAGFGIQIGDSVVHARIVNPTCDRNGLGALYSGGMNMFTQGTVTGNKGQDVEFINYIVSNNHGWGITCPGVTPNKPSNIITRGLANANSAGSVNGASMMTVVAPNYSGDPMYANHAGKDFRPSMAGAAFDRGDPDWTPARDHAGAARLTADLGAFASV